MVAKNGIWWFRTNQEIKHLYRSTGLVAEYKRVRIKWIGDLKRMEDERSVKKVQIGKPLERVWKRKARKRNEWKAISKEARILLLS